MLNSLLDKITKEFSDWGKACIRNVLVLCLGILEHETVCLYKIKKSVGNYLDKPDTSVDSHYKRLLRVFQDYAYSRLWLELLTWVYSLLRLKSDYLVLDGTSWKKGKKWRHYLVLSIIYKNVAIPICWIDLKKHGNSNLKERKRLIKKAMKRFNLKGKILLADREYIGQEWFSFLQSCEIEFVIRLRSKVYKKEINSSEGRTYEELKAKALRSKVNGKSIKKRFELNGCTLTFVVMKNPKLNAKEPLIYFISSLDLPAPKISQMYPIRWQIEVCFKHLKSNGFDLEKINVQGPAKQQLMMAIVVFSYTISVLEGLKTYRKVGIKKYASGKEYKAVSVFRYGLDKLLNQCYDFFRFCNYLTHELVNSIYRYRNENSVFVQ